MGETTMVNHACFSGNTRCFWGEIWYPERQYGRYYFHMEMLSWFSPRWLVFHCGI